MLTDDHTTRLSHGSMISVGLVIALLAAAVAYGRQSQRLDSIDRELTVVRVELASLREMLIRDMRASRPPAGP